MSDEPIWPREIWMAELDEHHNGRGDVVLSEHATVPRYEGDKERDREFHRYVDGDIFDSHEKYAKHQRDEAADELDRLRAENERLRALVDRANDLISGDLVGGEWKRASRGFCRDARAALKIDGGKE